MAAKPKAVKKAEKASVQVSSKRATGNLPALGKSVKANAAAGTSRNNASGYAAKPGSPIARKQLDSKTGSKQSGIKQTLQKRVNQSKVARGEKPDSVYTTKANSEKITLRADSKNKSMKNR
jgi:hypothetical protein